MQRFDSILYAVTADTEAPALERAVALAESNQARLTVVTAMDEVPFSRTLPGMKLTTEALRTAMREQKERLLEELVAPLRSRVTVQIKVLTGSYFLAIIQEVLRSGHDLVVKSASGGGYVGRLFDSDEMHLLRKCPCPVWLLKADAPAKFRRVLAAVDVAEHYPEEEMRERRAFNLSILEQAASVALTEFAELHVVSAWQAIGESVMRGGFLNTPADEIRAYVAAEEAHSRAALRSLLDEAAGRVGRDAMAYLKPATHLPNGAARNEIPALAERIGADLVVLGTVARTGIPGFIVGNTAETILHRVACSVLALKPPGFVSPVAAQA